MSDKKISQLPAATLPLAGTEVLPIVQGGTTDQVSVANLTAGRAISATELTLSTGNLIQGTAARGVNFTANTPAAGMTSQLLNAYEEGTWYPLVIGSSGGIPGGYARLHGNYTRIGRLVTCDAQCVITGLGTLSGNFKIGNLPFIAGGASSPSGYPAIFGYVDIPSAGTGYVISGYLDIGTNEISILRQINGTSSPCPVGSVFDVMMTITYVV